MKTMLFDASLLGLTTLALLSGSVCPAQATPLVSHTGANGINGEPGTSGGNGSDGVDITSAGTYTAGNSPILIGGNGGNGPTRSRSGDGGPGQHGGDGLDAGPINGGTATFDISSGMFTGGNGGDGTGTGGKGGTAGSGLVADFGSIVDITGGTFTGGIGGTGASKGTNGYGLMATNSGVITLFGTGFSAYGPLSGSGSITGTLENGSGPETITYDIKDNGSITLDNSASPAPEPSSMALFACVSLGLGGLIWRARRKAEELTPSDRPLPEGKGKT